MPTLVITFAFLSSAQSFAGTAGAASTLTWDGTLGNPLGALKTVLVGSNKSDSNTWTLTTTWQGLGVPANTIVTGVTSGSLDSRCSAFVAGTGCTTGASTLVDGATTITLSAQRSIVGSEGAFVNSTGTNLLNLNLASSNNITLTIPNHLGTTSGGSGKGVTLYQDNLNFTITYQDTASVQPSISIPSLIQTPLELTRPRAAIALSHIGPSSQGKICPPGPIRPGITRLWLPQWRHTASTYRSGIDPSVGASNVALGSIAISGAGAFSPESHGPIALIPGYSQGQIGRPGPARPGFSRFWRRVQVATTYMAGVDSSIGTSAVTLGSVAVSGSATAASTTGTGAVTIGSMAVAGSAEAAATTAGIGAVPRIGARPYGQIGVPGPARPGLSRLWHRVQVATTYGPIVINSSTASGAITTGSMTVAGSSAASALGSVGVVPHIGARPYGQIGQPGPARAGFSRFWHRVQVATTYGSQVGSSTGSGAVTLGSTSVSSSSAAVVLSGGVTPLIGARAQGQIGAPGPAPIGFSRFWHKVRLGAAYGIYPNPVSGSGDVSLGSTAVAATTSVAAVGTGSITLGPEGKTATTGFSTNATGAVLLGAKTGLGSASLSTTGSGAIVLASGSRTGSGAFSLSARSPGGVNSLIEARSQGQIGRAAPAPVGFSRFWQRQRVATTYKYEPVPVISIGSGAIVLGAKVGSGTASLATPSSGSVALSGLATAGVGRLTVTATSANTLNHVVVAGSGTAVGGAVSGAGPITLAIITASASGALANSATGALTLASISVAGVAPTIYSSGAATLAALSASGVGVMDAPAFGTIVLAGLTVADVEDFTASSTGAITLSPLSATGISQDRTASGAITLSPLATSGISQDRTASGAITLSPMSAAGVSVDFRGIGHVTLSADSASGSGVFTATSSDAITLNGFIVAGAGFNVPVGDILAFGTVTLSPLGVSGSGSLAIASSGSVTLGSLIVTASTGFAHASTSTGSVTIGSLVVTASPLFAATSTGTPDLGAIEANGSGSMSAEGAIVLDAMTAEGVADFALTCSGVITLDPLSPDGVAVYETSAAGLLDLNPVSITGTGQSLGGIDFIFGRFDADLANLISIALHDHDLAEVSADAGSLSLLQAHDLDMAEVDPDLADLMWFTTHDPGFAEVDPDISTLITL